MTVQRALFGWLSVTVGGTITAGSEAAGLPASNLGNDQGSASSAWQTVAGVTTSFFQIDGGNPSQHWRAFLLARTNLTDSATVRWRVSNSSTMSSPTYDSGVISAGIIAGYYQTLTVAPAAVTGQYCRCSIVDTGNPDGFLNIPLAYAGPSFQPAVNPSWSSAVGRDGQVDMVTSKGGQQYPTQRWQRRRWSLKMEGIHDTETWAQFMELDRRSRAGGNVLFVPDYTNGNANYEAVLGICTPKADLGFATTSPDARSWAADITERL